MNKILTIVFSAVIAVSLVLAAVAFFGGAKTPKPIQKEVPVEGTAPPPTDLTVVRATNQTAVSRPAGFPDPEEDWVKLPDGDNLAFGKEVASGEVTEIYAASNVVDGDTNTYWESKGLPAELTINLADTYNVQTVAVRLNPAPIWEARNQNFEILTSTDGVNFTEVSPNQRHDFDPDTGNIARVDFTPTQAQYVRLVFTSKSSGRSNGAQAAEIEIYE